MPQVVNEGAPGRHQAAKTKEKMEMVFAPSPLWGPERSARPEGRPESPQDGPKGSGGVGSGLQPPPRDPLPPPRSSPHPTPPPPPPLIPHSPSRLPSPSFSSPLPLVILAFFHSLLLFNPPRYPSPSPSPFSPPRPPPPPPRLAPLPIRARAQGSRRLRASTMFRSAEEHDPHAGTGTARVGSKIGRC